MLELVLNKLGLKRLEPDDRKLSCPVLRGWKRWQHLFHYPTLVIVFFNLFISHVYAETDIEWAQNISKESKEILFDKIKEIMKGPGFDQEKAKEVLKPRSALQIFVSTSMRVELLKKYVNEAKKYNGVLVLRGLPKGSMMEFINLAHRLSSNDSSAIQIDDEAFEAYRIDKVPAIVLSQPISIVDSQKHNIKFDKISGCVSIKAALEKFKENGDMSNEAEVLLQ